MGKYVNAGAALCEAEGGRWEATLVAWARWMDGRTRTDDGWFGAKEATAAAAYAATA